MLIWTGEIERSSFSLSHLLETASLCYGCLDHSQFTFFAVGSNQCGQVLIH